MLPLWSVTLVIKQFGIHVFRSRQLQVGQGTGELGGILNLVMLTATECLVQILSPSTRAVFFQQD